MTIYQEDETERLLSYFQKRFSIIQSVYRALIIVEIIYIVISCLYLVLMFMGCVKNILWCVLLQLAAFTAVFIAYLFETRLKNKLSALIREIDNVKCNEDALSRCGQMYAEYDSEVSFPRSMDSDL